MELPDFLEQTEKPSGSVHSKIQSAAAVVTCIAAVAAAISASKDRTIAWILIAICAVAVLVMLFPFIQSTVASAKKRKRQAAKNVAAKSKYSELVSLAKRFGTFTNTGDPSNILLIIQNSCANDTDKYSEICPPDYMKDVFPIFLQHLETRPPENEAQFLLSIQELYALVASYTREYVSEPFRKMRLKKWPLQNPSVLHEAMGTANPSNPKLGPWLYSLPPHYRESAEAQIEDFRERWASFQDDMKKWMVGINESFGTTLHTYFERPKKL
ncbi:Uncharacterised protein [uncultured archaeon]|nr:Uncharacterised protein [uncultured archaeon]